MVTEWLGAQARRIAPSPFSPETQVIIAEYAPANPEANRQIAELGLVACYGVPMVPTVALWGFVGWTVDSMTGSTEWVTRLGWGLLVVLLTGLGLHLVRYYDALIRRTRGRQPAESQARWPVISGDLDLVIQVVIGVVAVVVGAPG
jgi:hypothetical protein